VYQDFTDPDGNFLEQFQSTGFDARYFELYLFAYFSRSDYQVDRTHPNPDFLVSSEGTTVAVEATTVNPSTSGILSKIGRKIDDLSPEELREYQKNELAIRFGSPLFSKLQKRYWELDHCRDIPFVIAIEAFHDEESLALTDSALSGYVYGLSQQPSWSPDCKLDIATTDIAEHQLGEKTIPSRFFGQPGAEHISAILFTNSGTNAKFSRMGFQTGFGCDSVDIRRTGFCYNPDPDAMDPTFFSYNLDEPPLVESWGQGLVVLHNPSCLHPLPPDFFVDAVQGYLKGGAFRSDHLSWHPFSSKTMIVHLGDVKNKLPRALRQKGRFMVGAITNEEFASTCGFSVAQSNPLHEEQGWFADETGSFLGAVVRDKVDGDWGYVVLARDAKFRFRAIEAESSLPSRDQARMTLQMTIARLLSRPQRIFPQ
jgi:hypothetical protein